MFHIACRISGEEAERYLERLLEGKKVSRHQFETLEELLTLAQRFTIDMIYMGISSEDNGSVMKLLELTRRIKDHIFLAILPTVLYHPAPEGHVLVAAFENGAEDFFSALVPLPVARAKIGMMVRRAFRDLSVNPSSRLPGPAVIEKEIERQIELGQQFAIGYADLDNFKAYNDYYGYFYGDRIIRLTSRIIRDVVFDLCREGFVGHIGGDDFIFIIPGDAVPAICENIIKTFDLFIPFRYAGEDRHRGCIITKNRRDEEEVFSIMTLSIAVVINRGKMFRHVGEMSHMLADLKKYAKSLPGSNYVIERRRKY